MPTSEIDLLIRNRIASIDEYLSHTSYQSYDPYDGLASPLAKLLLSQSQLFSRIWQQAIRLFPINIRPLIGIRKMSHTKAISDFASAYCILFSSAQNESYELKARQLLRYLETVSSPTPNGLGWGLRFPFATRFVKADENQVNIFQTINAIHSFLDGFETFKDPVYLEVAIRGFKFLEYDLGYVESNETIYWKYWTGLEVEIFNVSGLMIGLCGRMRSATNENKYLTFAQKLFCYIKQAQNSDGSWYYSADPKGWFIDGFHTGYILEGICRGIMERVIDKDAALEKGVEYYLKHFFTKDGTPRYFHNATYPIDGQNAAQALQTLHFILNVNFAVHELVGKSLKRIDELLWSQRGYYYYKRSKLMVYKTPMHRWVTGPMLLSLSYLKKSF